MKRHHQIIALLTLVALYLSCNGQTPRIGVDDYLLSFKTVVSATPGKVDQNSLTPLARSPFYGRDKYPVMKYPLADEKMLPVLIEPKTGGGKLHLEVLEDRELVLNQCIAEFSFGAWLNTEFSSGTFSTTIIQGDFAQFTKYRIEEESITCIGLVQVFE